MLLASLANIKLGWKGLPRTNTLAYYENPEVTSVKSLIVQAQLVIYFGKKPYHLDSIKIYLKMRLGGKCVIKHFFVATYE